MFDVFVCLGRSGGSGLRTWYFNLRVRLAFEALHVQERDNLKKVQKNQHGGRILTNFGTKSRFSGLKILMVLYFLQKLYF